MSQLGFKFFVYEEDGVRSAINLNQIVSATVGRIEGKPVLIVAMTDGEKRYLHPDFIGNFFQSLGPLDAKRFGKPASG